MAKRIAPLTLVLLLFMQPAFAQAPGKYNAIYSGTPWLDDKGNAVSAHGANIIKEKNRYYLFGERHSDTSNAFVGFNCYSSPDLINWTFESIALPQQPSGKLGPNRVGERAKVMKCPATGEFIMYMHVDTIGYKDQFVGYATAKRITGPYLFKGPLLFNGKPIKKWDMGTFQDKDGTGYVLLHGGDIYKLSNDFTSVTEQVNKAMERGFESPAIFRKDSLYYFLGSHLTGWERNDNYYFTSRSLSGPWTQRGTFAPAGTLTWNSQTTFVLPIESEQDTLYMFMGDRWSYPKQASAATYVWQPFTVQGDSLFLPQYLPAWKPGASNSAVTALPITGETIQAADQKIAYTGEWKQDTLAVRSAAIKGNTFTTTFTGTRILLYSLARPDGGYAGITLRNSKDKQILHATVDMYSQYPTSTLSFASPSLPRGTYTLQVTVLGENWYWTDKRNGRTGSKGYNISVEKIIVE
ncbi:Glycosyl hydrolases family 43 [Filimonas lacunae]|uniref:Glycosyl hydrolases family 43 n=1 Tax=Filimonas lacunae TaxID=477680 RepID=A0A173MDA7_9BACT|nr:family 43 glycosylhydrolase [Filimonas lacunae]BAV05545.1 hypothetical protein FLA_1552 [Filimonas lacunae]SIT20462.1 Glycosyl hydrolases family 43 [Filimonas lacunae]